MKEILTVADLPFPLGIPQDIPEELHTLAEAGGVVIVGSGESAMAIPVKRGKAQLLEDRAKALAQADLQNQ